MDDDQSPIFPFWGCDAMTTSQSASLVRQGRIKRGNCYSEPKVPLTVAQKPRTKQSGRFTKIPVSARSRAKHPGRHGVFAVFALLVSAPSLAATDIAVWHTLHGAHKTAFENLVQQFNRKQKDVKVTLKGFDNARALGDTRLLDGKTRPHLVQLPDNRTPEIIAEHRSILPLHRLLAAHPIKDLAWFLPQGTRFVRDAGGRFLAFPFMAEIPVMFYNIDAYQKAGLDVDHPGRTWADLQGNLIGLYDSGVSCPYVTSQQVMVHFENLAAVNRKVYASAQNGLGTGKPALQFDALYMRHLSLMVSWKRSQLLTNHSDDDAANALFAKGKCGVLTAGSGAIGDLLDSKTLKFAVAPLPYYQQVSKQAGRAFVSGSALWAVAGHPRTDEKATAAFLAYLATPAVAASWHQRTGFLPLTQAAFQASSAAYDRIPGSYALLSTLRAAPQPTSQGFRLPNYTAITPVLSQSFEAALSGQTPPMKALDDAKMISARLMR